MALFMQPTNKNTILFQPQTTNGNGPLRDYLFENIDVIHQGSQIAVWGFGHPHTHNQLKNIAIDDRGSSSTLIILPCLWVQKRTFLILM